MKNTKEKYRSEQVARMQTCLPHLRLITKLSKEQFAERTGLHIVDVEGLENRTRLITRSDYLALRFLFLEMSRHNTYIRRAMVELLNAEIAKGSTCE